MSIPRREFLHQMLGGVAAATALPVAVLHASPELHINRARFPQGVASADPLSDAITLWTRIEPVASAPPMQSLRAQISTSSIFDSVVLDTVTEANRDDDYTVRLFVDGLASDKTYYFRFITDTGEASRTGRTRTAPEPDADRAAVIGFASCQNYEQGFYGAWARMISEDQARPKSEQIDFILHLGDFIYERYRGRALNGERFARKLPDFPDGKADGERVFAWSLADYRHLYKVYLSDPHLQAARARWPFVCTWDDHEFSNDSYQGAATYHETIVGHQQRKRHANKAWFEFVPASLDSLRDKNSGQHAHDFVDKGSVTNGSLGKVGADGLHDDAATRNALSSLCIYRSLRWGRHVDLLITDLRSYRSPPAVPFGLAKELGLQVEPAELVEICDAGREYNSGNPPDTLPYGNGKIPNPARERAPGSMLGTRQRQWFEQQLQQSDATWRVWANGIPCMKLCLDLSTLPFMNMSDSILIQDAWAGYPTELRGLLSYIKRTGRANLVSLSGDHHMNAAALLYPEAGDSSKAAGMDFATSGISSTPHWESAMHQTGKSGSSSAMLCGAEVDGELRNTWNMSFLHGVLATMTYVRTGLLSVAQWLGPNKANRGLRYIDTDSNGYGVARFDGSGMNVDLITVSDTTEPCDLPGPDILRTISFQAASVRPGEEPVLVGPHISGTPPFPYSET